MAPGDVILHAISTPHGSRANDSDTLRRVFYVHFMAREVMETLHPEWVGTHRGFEAGDVEQVQDMVEERIGAGRWGPETALVELTPDGFVFAGLPATPRWHWQTLITDMSPHVMKEAKMLIRSAR
jgi:hypothetical protein